MELKKIGSATKDGYAKDVKGAKYMMAFHEHRLVSIWSPNAKIDGTDYIVHDTRHPKATVNWWALF